MDDKLCGICRENPQQIRIPANVGYRVCVECLIYWASDIDEEELKRRMLKHWT